jgi:hypothetical protein
MSWRTEVSLKNNSDNDVLCVIPKGQVFDNKKIGSGIQNVAASREYKLIIPAKSRMKLEVEVYCINRRFSSPSGSPGNVTVFQIDQSFSSQEDLWKIMGVPLA